MKQELLDAGFTEQQAEAIINTARTMAMSGGFFV
jgi:hypothetical protein